MTVIQMYNEHLQKNLFNSLINEGTSKKLKFVQRILRRHAYRGSQGYWNEFTNRCKPGEQPQGKYGTRKNLFTSL